MTDLISLIFWSFLGLLALASLIAMIRMGYKPRETGPWVVTRVASDGSGCVEFWMGVVMEHQFLWTSLIDSALKFQIKKEATKLAEFYLADVHPLSRYVGGVR